MGLGSNTPDEQTVTQRQSPELTKRILVVEDDPSVQKILKRLFEAEGFAVEGRLDGQAGLDSFHADAPARIRVALRHSNPPARENEVMFDRMVVNFEKMEVTRNGASIALTAREFKTLRFFVQNSDRIITRAELLNKVWGNENGETATRTIDNHIMKLRQKLEEDPGRPIHFRTVHRFGYRFTF